MILGVRPVNGYGSGMADFALDLFVDTVYTGAEIVTLGQFDNYYIDTSGDPISDWVLSVTGANKEYFRKGQGVGYYTGKAMETVATVYGVAALWKSLPSIGARLNQGATQLGNSIRGFMNGLKTPPLVLAGGGGLLAGGATGSGALVSANTLGWSMIFSAGGGSGLYFGIGIRNGSLDRLINHLFSVDCKVSLWPNSANAPKGGFGLFGRNVPLPSGPASASLRNLFIRNAESPLFRWRVDLLNKLRGRSPVDWDSFMTRLRSADFNDYASWAEARKSLGFANSGPNGWLFGLAKPLRQIPGIRNAATRHELFHAVDDLTTGLFGQSKTVGLWLRAETNAHLIGGPLIGVPAFGFLGWSIYVGIDGITDLWKGK